MWYKCSSARHLEEPLQVRLVNEVPEIFLLIRLRDFLMRSLHSFLSYCTYKTSHRISRNIYIIVVSCHGNKELVISPPSPHAWRYVPASLLPLAQFPCYNNGDLMYVKVK